MLIFDSFKIRRIPAIFFETRNLNPELSFPHDSPCIQQVHSFQELLTTQFTNGVNALCWPRSLPGDFSEIIKHISHPDATGADGIAILDESWLAGLDVSAAGRIAIGILLEDQRLLREEGLSPILNCIHRYTRDDPANPVPTDVHSFHVDSATVEADTWLCTYHGAASEGLCNEQALRRVDIPETRAALLKAFGGADGDVFREYLAENCYDLHYVPIPGAVPFSFGLGNLWRIATEYPGSPVPPCIHRAPAPSAIPRLLLIS